MAIQTKQVEFAKETDDVLVGVIGLLQDIKGGKTATEILAGALPRLMEAVGGIDQVDNEVAEHRKVALQTIGYRTGELAAAIIG